MPFVLIIAFAASLGLHAAALFGPAIELGTEPESMPLAAELRAAPRPVVETLVKPGKARPDTRKPLPRAVKQPPRSTPVLSVPDTTTIVAPGMGAEPVALPETPEMSAAPAPRLPPHGMIRYRVDRGDSNFEIGVSRHEWAIADGRYRLTSVVETTGLAWLFKSYLMEMESRGQMTPEGLQPDYFVIRRNRSEMKEKVFFDWETMKVRVGSRGEYLLSAGAQDLLSFNYQLGFLPQAGAGGSLPIATGKKYGVYRLESLGDEDVDVPAGVFRTIHLRAPGENTTELWLAYDYLLLPVKIRHVDSKGDSLVQVATEIQLGAR